MRAVRNVLFGVVAVQMNFIDRVALVEGLRSWSHEKGKSLGEILIERGAIDPGEREVLEVLVEMQLGRHADDLTESLSPLQSFSVLREELASIGDDEIAATLPRVSPICASNVDVSLVSTSGVRAAGVDTSHRATIGASTGSAKVRPATSNRFTVVRPHAEGALGQVSVALDGELSREVALKEIKPEFSNDRQSQTRFLLEAEITGGLEHPGIVPVYSLGQYADGRPYYAMRFIRGESLRDTCDEFHQCFKDSRDQRSWNLELRKLLGRFVDVCNAIDYAHSRGVLHRDLKPANIMLGRFGETLVVDWGLAKVLGTAEYSSGVDEEETLRPPAHSGTDPTLYGFAVGTVAYMPPEQAAGRLDFLSPASDVYSLGATLYNILTGRAPFRREREGDDVRARVMQGQFIPPRKIERRIVPALEAICLKAMALAPADRYQSARDLADDIEHYLADEPVTAFREPLRQRLSRLTRRHKSWTQAAAAALVLVAGISAAAVLVVTQERNAAVTARNEALFARNEALAARQQAEDERQRADLNAHKETEARIAADESRNAAEMAQQRAEHETEIAKRVSGFLVGLFQGADPITIGGSSFTSGRQISPDITAREVVDLGAGILLSDTNMDPVIRATLLDQIGAVYLSLGKYDEADRLIGEALAIRREHLPADDLQLAESLTHAGTLKHLLAYYEDAEQLLREATAVFNTRGGTPTFEQSTAHLMLGWTLAEGHGSTDKEVRMHADKALEIRVQLVGDSSRDVGTTYLLRGVIEANLRNIPGFVENAVEAMEIWRTLPGGEHLASALLKSQAMLVAIAADRTEAAATHAREASQEIRAGFGDDSPLTLSLLWALAFRLALDGDDNETANELLDAIDADIRRMFQGHPRMRHYLANRISISPETQPERTAQLCAESVELLEGLIRKHPDLPRFQNDLVDVYDHLGSLQSQMGRVAEALVNYRKSLELLTRLPNTGTAARQAQVALACRRIGLESLHLGQVDDAVAALGHTKERFQALVRESPSELRIQEELATSCDDLAAAWRASGDFQQALDNSTEAYEIFDRLSRDYPRSNSIAYQRGKGIAVRGVATAHALLGHLTDAVTYYRQSLSLLEPLLQQRPDSLLLQHDLTLTLQRFAGLLATDATETVLDGAQAMALATRACELSEWKDTDTLEVLAAACAESGDFPKAIEQQTKAIELASESTRASLQARLELYQAGKPCRELPERED